MDDIRELKVYIEALNFSNLIWDICKDWNSFSKRTVGIQLVQAADSISANIAEG
ncbi:MAG: four helix bundle protein [Candidatus Cloacimonetes bacterium]|nr:four helix bundle protein [Candidatus Cloacimonadota bacterium]